MLLLWQAVTAVAALALVLAWYQVSGEGVSADQKTGMNVSIAAVIVAGAAGALFLLAGRRAVGVRRESLVASLPALDPKAPPTASDGLGLVAGEGLLRFHRADCQLAQNRNWPPASRAEHQAQGRTACGACKP